MKSFSLKIKIMLLFTIIFLFNGCSKKSEETFHVKRIEVYKVSFNGGPVTFETDKMKVLDSWVFGNTASMKVIYNKTVIGNLEPRTERPLGENLDNYYIKIYYDDVSVEEWIFWLDSRFSKDGVAENVANPGRYKLLDKKDVARIGKLLGKL